jgi:hypothetical protein
MAVFIGTDQDNTLMGTDEQDRLEGRGGNDILYGFGPRGVDTIAGTFGGDILDGGDGFDFAAYDKGVGGVLPTAGIRVFLYDNQMNFTHGTGNAFGDSLVGIEGAL